MIIIDKLRQLLVRSFVDMQARTVALVLLIYIAVCWGLLRLAGEAELTGWPDFFYYLVVTASTVGYGDLSPQTAAGRWVVSLLVIPFGLGLFAMVLGRIAAFLSNQWSKGVRGLKTLDCDDHILVLGWNGKRTLQLLKLLLREYEVWGEQTPIALCVTAEIENPMPEHINFVHTPAFTDDESMDRAGVARARCIIIDSEDDNTTMTAALYCNARNPDAHIIVYFRDEALAGLLSQHCPNAECAPSVAIEMLVKSAVDPGSSTLHHKLLNVEHGQTQYSLRYPASRPKTTVEALFLRFKRQHQATLIGIRRGAEEVMLNPSLEQTVPPGAVLYYIAERRIVDVDWNG